jgi:dienelactone hydrolase
VVVQEIFGANPHIRSVAERFAAEGYAVLAPSFFDLVDGPDADPDALPYDAEGVKQGLERVGALGMEKALEVVRAAAPAGPYGKVGTVGYCWGGTVAMLSALRLGLPSVSYYGARNAVPRRDAQGPGDLPLRRPGPQHPAGGGPGPPREAAADGHLRLSGRSRLQPGGRTCV